jgi:NAD(P)-dependent dehydrogenase (short-subunit alcohol dehydrogenase family)
MANYLIVGGTKGIGLETVLQLNQARSSSLGGG